MCSGEDLYAWENFRTTRSKGAYRLQSREAGKQQFRIMLLDLVIFFNEIFLP